MSLTVTTDVFCDATDDGGPCEGWIFGTTSNKTEGVEARRRAASAGWRRRRVDGRWLDLCPEHSSPRPPVVAPSVSNFDPRQRNMSAARETVGKHYDLSVFRISGYEGIVVHAGRSSVKRVVPPAGEDSAFEHVVWDHRIEVSVSPTGRSVQVFIDGKRVLP